MSKNISDVAVTDTFQVWLDKTNELAEAFATTVTLDEPNIGNVSLTGDLSILPIEDSPSILNVDRIKHVNTLEKEIFFDETSIYVEGRAVIARSINEGIPGIPRRLDFIQRGGEAPITWTVGPEDIFGGEEVGTQYNQRFSITAPGFISDLDVSLYIDLLGEDQTAIANGKNLKLSNDLLQNNIGVKDTEGNALTATRFQTPVTLSFSGDIVTQNIPLSGDESAIDDGSVSIPITLNGGQVDKWINAKTLNFTGDVTGSATINGDLGTNNEIEVEMTVVDDEHNHVIGNVDGLTDALDAKVSVAGDSMTGNLTVGNTTNGVRVGTNGTIVATGDITAFGSFSDISRKENIKKIENALDKIEQISGYTFNYIGDDTRVSGVIAQEVEEVLPEVVYDTIDNQGNDTKAVRYGNMMGLIIEAIKELRQEIETLKN